MSSSPPAARPARSFTIRVSEHAVLRLMQRSFGLKFAAEHRDVTNWPLWIADTVRKHWADREPIAPGVECKPSEGSRFTSGDRWIVPIYGKALWAVVVSCPETKVDMAAVTVITGSQREQTLTARLFHAKKVGRKKAK